MNELEMILRQLAGVSEQMSRLPRDAFDERARLQAERERLHAEAAKARQATAVTGA